MISSVQRDVYEHMKQDVGLAKDGSELDARDSRGLYQIIGLSDTSLFHMKVVPTILPITIDQYLPVIQYRVMKLKEELGTHCFSFRVDLAVVTNDPTLEQILTIVRRIEALFGAGDLWNACPHWGAYSEEMRYLDESDTGVVSSNDGLHSRALSFVGATQMSRDLGGRIKWR